MVSKNIRLCEIGQKLKSTTYTVGDSYEGISRTDETNQIRGGAWKETATRGETFWEVEMFFFLIGVVFTGVYTFVKCHLDVYLYVNFTVCKL